MIRRNFSSIIDDSLSIFDCSFSKIISSISTYDFLGLFIVPEDGKREREDNLMDNNCLVIRFDCFEKFTWIIVE